MEPIDSVRPRTARYSMGKAQRKIDIKNSKREADDLLVSSMHSALWRKGIVI
jgi:hypothetical protein